ncbi:MAG: hypothetical protein J1F11_02700 [Oscillospiraceae bacterium]|nr:hypothetical protein [Oscillospiraceae bacterium]
MFETEEKIRKCIITPDGEDEFQLRYISDENVGLVTTRSEKSYLILDSIDYWYDLIQNGYPTKRKCKCKNDFFKLYFDYVPRVGTDDYRAVELISCCTECGKERTFAAIDIDYSPTEQLYEQPITYCEKPKIKYKTYSIKGYWKEEVFYALTDFLSQQQLLRYCFYWDNGKRIVEKFTAEELKRFLFEEKNRYLSIYFSLASLDELFSGQISDDKGIYIDTDIWRKEEIIKLNSPFIVAGYGQFYEMEFCSEYIEAGQVKAKSEAFCSLAQKVWEYSRKELK